MKEASTNTVGRVFNVMLIDATAGGTRSMDIFMSAKSHQYMLGSCSSCSEGLKHGGFTLRAIALI